MSTISTYMGFPISTIGTDSGLNWETNLNAALNTIDQHDHSSGQGVQVTPAGLNINVSLPFNNNAAVGLLAAVFNSQVSFSTLQSVYVIPPDLYYNDSNGNVIRITAGGQVNATAATIPGESYSGGTFIWVQTQSALPTTPANFDIGSVTLRPNTAATTNGVVLGPPAGIASQYGIQLPANPSGLSGTSFMTLDTSGNMAAPYPVANGIPQSALQLRPAADTAVAGGLMMTPSSGAFSTSASSLTPVTNLSGSLVTSGRPVQLALNPDGTNGNAYIGSLNYSQLTIFRGATAIAFFEFGSNAPVSTIGTVSPPGAISFVDTVVAGTYTYSVQVRSSVSATTEINNCVLIAYEI